MSAERETIIGVDFDGTVVTHKFPEIGDPVPHAIDVLRKLAAKNVRLVLWTVRSDDFLQAAVEYMAQRGHPALRCES